MEKRGSWSPFLLGKIILNAAVLLVLALCWVVADHFPPWLAFHTEMPAFAASSIALLACIVPSRQKVPVPAGVVLCLLMAASAGVQWACGLITYGGDVWVAAAYILVFAIAWLWAHQWVRFELRYNLLNAVAVFLVCVGLATTFQLLMQWLHVESGFSDWVLDALPNGRARANLGQPNQAATTVVMATIAAGFLCARGQIHLTVAWCLALMFILATTVTQSRTALLSAAVITVGFGVMAKQHRARVAAKLNVMVWLMLLWGAAWAFANVGVGEYFGSVNSQALATSGTRPLIWHQLIQAVLERPWFGWGWLQIATAHQTGAVGYPGTEQVNYSHNIVLDSLVMLGIPITVALFFSIAGWLWYRGKALLQSPQVSWAVAMLAPFLVHSMLELPHAYAYYLMLAGMLVGYIDAITEQPQSWILYVHRSVLTALAVVWFSLLTAMGREYFLAEEDFRMNRFENRKIGPPMPDYKPPDLLFLTQLGDLAHAMRLRATPNMPVQDINTLVNVAKRYTWGPVQFRAALALGLNGRPVEAAERLAVIKNLFGDDIYQEARENFVQLQVQKYAILGAVTLP